jgi:hypothetical protein
MDTELSQPDDAMIDQEPDCGCDGGRESAGRPRPEAAGRPCRPRQHFLIDVITGTVLASMVGTGILPGIRGGRGLTWLGQGRHFWGDVHFWLAVALVALVIVHLALHFSWIKSCWRRFVGTLTSPMTWALALAGVTLMVLPLIIPVEQGRGGQGRGRGPSAAAAHGQGDDVRPGGGRHADRQRRDGRGWRGSPGKRRRR